MSNREQIKQVDLRINSLRIELIKIISQINYSIGHDRRAILSPQYKALKKEYYSKKEEINSLRYIKDTLSGNFNTYLKAS
jgi:hypothetical protein